MRLVADLTPGRPICIGLLPYCDDAEPGRSELWFIDKKSGKTYILVGEEATNINALAC